MPCAVVQRGERARSEYERWPTDELPLRAIGDSSVVTQVPCDPVDWIDVVVELLLVDRGGWQRRASRNRDGRGWVVAGEVAAGRSCRADARARPRCSIPVIERVVARVVVKLADRRRCRSTS